MALYFIYELSLAILQEPPHTIAFCVAEKKEGFEGKKDFFHKNGMDKVLIGHLIRKVIRKRRNYIYNDI